jgi:hypothetical protein
VMVHNLRACWPAVVKRGVTAPSKCIWAEGHSLINALVTGLCGDAAVDRKRTSIVSSSGHVGQPAADVWSELLEVEEAVELPLIWHCSHSVCS